MSKMNIEIETKKYNKNIMNIQDRINLDIKKTLKIQVDVFETCKCILDAKTKDEALIMFEALIKLKQEKIDRIEKSVK